MFHEMFLNLPFANFVTVDGKCFKNNFDIQVYLVLSPFKLHCLKLLNFKILPSVGITLHNTVQL